ncbi:uncharacterized protein LOC118408808 isoform X2 [Branchiostoma floridae]|uniref:Uncharacterized protein LOC118408808 isoform X2 n=1 Tax=Branchiostoma floridae TaxID=7739 RepID=A0A9J7HTG1_BRAFL|nr:uncharacterized protein LOC118408808 isoform X2 [Branchiostoma floridae]
MDSHVSWVRTVDELLESSGTRLPSAKRLNRVCPLCPVTKFKPADSKRKLELHVATHVKRAVLCRGMQVCACFNPCKGARQDGRGHYHCPICGDAVSRKPCFLSHLKSHRKKAFEQEDEDQNVEPRPGTTRTGPEESGSHQEGEPGTPCTGPEESGSHQEGEPGTPCTGPEESGSHQEGEPGTPCTGPEESGSHQEGEPGTPCTGPEESGSHQEGGPGITRTGPEESESHQEGGPGITRTGPEESESHQEGGPGTPCTGPEESGSHQEGEPGTPCTGPEESGSHQEGEPGTPCTGPEESGSHQEGEPGTPCTGPEESGSHQEGEPGTPCTGPEESGSHQEGEPGTPCTGPEESGSHQEGEPGTPCTGPEESGSHQEGGPGITRTGPEESESHQEGGVCDASIKGTTKQNILSSSRNPRHISNRVETMQKNSDPSMATCGVCKKTMQKKNLKRHIRDIHASSSKPNISQDRHHAGISVDPQSGLYMVSKSIRGRTYPLHVRLQMTGPNQHIKCEQEDCKDIGDAFSRGGDVSWQCSHILSVRYAEATPPVVKLEEADLQRTDMTEERKADCRALKVKADCANAPLVVPWKAAAADEVLFLSIYDGEHHHWAKLGRAVVMLQGHTINCTCCKMKRGCVHKGIVKWWHAKYHPAEVSSSTEDSDVSEHVDPVTDMLKDMTAYLKTKTIPADFDYKACTGQELLSKCIEPKEAMCPTCDNHPELQNELATSAARIIDLQGVTTDLRVYVRKCPQCHQTFRYQEHEDGILNYNNRTFLTLQLCFWLRAGVHHHVAVGRMTSILETWLGVSLPRQDILNGYLLFEVLCQHQYDYSCIRCGHHPPILMMDLDRKVAFHMAASTLNTTDNCTDEIDLPTFWDCVESEIVARGLLSSKLHCSESYLSQYI